MSEHRVNISSQNSVVKIGKSNKNNPIINEDNSPYNVVQSTSQNVVLMSGNSNIIKSSPQSNYSPTLAGTVAPRKLDQLTDVNLIGIQNGDLIVYDEQSKTFIPLSRNTLFPDEVNIVYVSKNGDDTNSGRSIQEAKLTIDAAVEIATEGTVIRISPGNYTINNPITLPDQVSLVGTSLREVSISGENPDDLFYVGNGNYIAEMSFVGFLTTGAAIFSFDPVSIRYINQSPYVQNCTNFVPNSIGMKINGEDAIGPIKSMVLDSYTQYNQGGIGISITNSGYAQLVSLFTICNDIAVYCGTGGACDLTNSNSSFGNYGLVADGVSPLQYVGIITENASKNFDMFEVKIEQPTYEVSNATYDNSTGLLTVYTASPHNLSVGMGVSIVGLGFTCTFEPGILTYPSGNKGYVFNTLTVAPGRYVDSYNLIQANKQEIIDTSYVAIGASFNPSPEKCKRDIGYIIDAVSKDVRDYTNKNSIDAVKSYFDYDGNLLQNGLAGEVPQTISVFNSARDLMKLAITNNLTVKDLTLAPDPLTGTNTDLNSCSNVQTFIDNLVGIITTTLNSGTLTGLPTISTPSNVFTAYVGVSTLSHTYNSGGTVTHNIIKPFDGQVVYFDTLFKSVNKIKLVDGGSGYTTPPIITIEPPLTSWGIPAQAISEVKNGSVVNIELVSSGRGYTNIPKITIGPPAVGINTARASIEILPTYYSVKSSTPIISGICTVTMAENIPYEIFEGQKVYFYKQSRVLASGHSLEYIGSGTNILTALPASGGVPIQENEVDARNGGLVVYTSTDQSGNFRIGDGVVINQQSGTISGVFYSKSLFSTMTPFILALGGD